MRRVRYGSPHLCASQGHREGDLSHEPEGGAALALPARRVRPYEIGETSTLACSLRSRSPVRRSAGESSGTLWPLVLNFGECVLDSAAVVTCTGALPLSNASTSCSTATFRRLRRFGGLLLKAGELVSQHGTDTGTLAGRGFLVCRRRHLGHHARHLLIRACGVRHRRPIGTASVFCACAAREENFDK